MQKSQKGFTLIELVVVIVLLGILGVSALARFQNLALEAVNATNQGIASEVTSGSSINYAAALTGLAGSTDISNATGTEDCPTIGAALMTGGALPADYFVTAGTGDCTPGAGTTFACTVGHTPSAGADTLGTATIICTGG